MKRILSLILTLAMCLPLIPASAIAEAAITTRETRAALQAEVDQYGGVEEAMSAYAKSRLRFNKSLFASMAVAENFGFRKAVQNVYNTGTAFTDWVMAYLIEAGIAVSANDNDWNLSENEVRLFMENVLLIAEMEALPFEKVTENVQNYTPDYSVGWGVAELVINLLSVGVNSIPLKDENVLKNMGTVFAKDLSADSFARHVLLNMDKYYNFANNTGEMAKLLDEHLMHEPAVKNILGSWKRMQAGQALLADIQKGGVADESLSLACLSLSDGYTAFGAELLELSKQEDLRLLAEDDEYLDSRLNAQLEASFVSHPSGAIISKVTGVLRAADILLTNGVGQASLEAIQGIGDLTVGTKSTFVHFQAMRSLNTLYAELEDVLIEPEDGAPWVEYYNYALNVQRLCKVALLGERHLYEMTTVDAGALRDLSDIEGENTVWYNGRVNTLQQIYNAAGEYMTALTTHYGALEGYAPTAGDLLGHENELTVTIAGRVIHDKWFADVKDPTKPDYEKPNPKEGEPVANLPVYLKVGDTIIGSGKTNDDGEYEITVYRYEIENRKTTIQFGDALSSEVEFADLLESELQMEQQFAKKDVDGVSGTTLTFCASYPYNIDAGETPLDADLTEGAVPVPYADDYFLADASEYNHNLAIASIALSAAASGQDSGAYNARAAWSRMGFGVVHRGGYGLADSEVNGTTGYTIAQKIITDDDAREEEPKKYRVVGLAIEGDVNTAQVAQLLNAGSDEEGYQLGVGAAAREIFSALSDYLISVDDEMPICVWITGFSRGGAVANAVAQKLCTTASLSYKWDKLFVYTFGAPEASASSRGFESRSGVFNIIHEEDLVAQLYDEWTYTRLGENLTFGGTSVAYAQLIASAFDLMTAGNTHYNPWTFEANRDVLDMIEAGFGKQVFDQKTYEETMQPLMMAIAHWTRLGGDPNADVSLMDKHTLILELTGEISDSLYADLRTIIDGATSGMSALIVEALPQEIYDNLGLLLTDVLLLTAYHQGDLNSLTLDATVNENLVALVAALMGDMSNSTSVYGTAFAHHPEVYLAWLAGMSGETLFGKETAQVFNTRVMPMQYNLSGVVLDKEDEKPLKDVSVIAWDENDKAIKWAVTDEEGKWQMLVPPDNYKVTFELEGYEPEEETVSKEELEAGPVELTTYMELLAPTTVYITTEVIRGEGNHYYYDVAKPHVTIPDYPNAAAKINNTLAKHFTEIDEEIGETISGAASCRYDTQDHSFYAYMTSAYSNGGILTVSVLRGVFVCHVGHNMNTSETYLFDVYTGNELALADLFDPENPDAEAMFIQLIDEALGEEAAVSAQTLYKTLLNQERYSSWRLDQNGMTLGFDRLNLGFEYPNSVIISMEKLETVLAEKFRANEVATRVDFSTITDGSAEKAEELGLMLCENTPGVGDAIVVDGLTQSIWVTIDYDQRNTVNCSSRYFYSFGLKDAMILLPEMEGLNYRDSVWITWQDADGDHFLGYPQTQAEAGE